MEKKDRIKEADKLPENPKDIRTWVKDGINTIHTVRRIKGPVEEYNGDLYFLVPDSDGKSKVYIKILGPWCGVTQPTFRLGEIYKDDDGIMDLVKPGDVFGVIDYGHNYDKNTKKTLLRIYDEIHMKVVNDDGDLISTPEALLKPMEQVFRSPDFKPYDIVDRLRYYIYLGDEREYFVMGAYIILTYLHRLFDVIPNLIIRGEKGAGKGHFLGILSYLVWNPTPLTSPSPASVYRHPEEHRGTLLIDEGHRILNMKGEVGQAIKTIVESGNQKGYKVPRYDDGKKTMFEPFCPKILTTNYSMEVEDKSIVIIPPKLRKDKKYGIRYTEKDTDLILEKAQYNLILWALWNYKEVMRVYKEDKGEMGEYVYGRYGDLWRPLLSIVKVAFPEKYKEILEYAKMDCDNRIEMKQGKEDTILKIIYDLIEDRRVVHDKNYYLIEVKEINDRLKDLGMSSLRGRTFPTILENLKITHTKGYKTGEWRILKEDLKKRFMEVLGEDDEIEDDYDGEKTKQEYQEAITKGDFQKLDEISPKIRKQEPETSRRPVYWKVGTVASNLSLETGMTIKDCRELLYFLGEVGKIQITNNQIRDHEKTHSIAKQHIIEYQTIKNLLQSKGPLTKEEIGKELGYDYESRDEWMRTVEFLISLGWLEKSDNGEIRGFGLR